MWTHQTVSASCLGMTCVRCNTFEAQQQLNCQPLIPVLNGVARGNPEGRQLSGYSVLFWQTNVTWAGSFIIEAAVRPAHKTLHKVNSYLSLKPLFSTPVALLARVSVPATRSHHYNLCETTCHKRASSTHVPYAPPYFIGAFFPPGYATPGLFSPSNLRLHTESARPPLGCMSPLISVNWRSC